ncbi:MAG: hypothetical protein ABR863_14280 [Roseiarcus sp.]
MTTRIALSFLIGRRFPFATNMSIYLVELVNSGKTFLAAVARARRGLYRRADCE